MFPLASSQLIHFSSIFFLFSMKWFGYKYLLLYIPFSDWICIRKAKQCRLDAYYCNPGNLNKHIQCQFYLWSTIWRNMLTGQPVICLEISNQGINLIGHIGHGSIETRTNLRNRTTCVDLFMLCLIYMLDLTIVCVIECYFYFYLFWVIPCLMLWLHSPWTSIVFKLIVTTLLSFVRGINA